MNESPFYIIRSIVWVIRVFTGILAFVGLLGFLICLTLIPGLGWMIWFLPLWFLSIFFLVLISNFLKWRHLDVE